MVILTEPLSVEPDSPQSFFRESNELSELFPHHHIHPDTLAKNIAIPTNKWWGNFLQESADSHTIEPIYAQPFTVIAAIDKCAQTKGLHFGYTQSYRVDGPPSGNGTIKYYYYPQVCDWAYSCAEFDENFPKFYVTSWDDLGVRTRFEPYSDSAKAIESYLSLGNAFISARITSLCAYIATSHAIISVNGIPLTTPQRKCNITPEHNSITVSLNNGHKWIFFIFTDDPSQGDQSVTISLSKIQFDGSFSGVIRSAFLRNGNENDAFLYSKHASEMLQGAEVCIETDSSYAVHWNTKNLVKKSAVSLLHFALPHHVHTMDKTSSTEVPLKLRSLTHGGMKAFTTLNESRKWCFKESKTQLPPSMFSTKELSREDIQTHSLVHFLQRDIEAPWTLPSEPGSYYFTGKAVQKYASIALLAKKMNDVEASSESAHLFLQALNKFQKVIKQTFLAHSNRSKPVSRTEANKFPLVYDTQYKGLVSSQGLETKDLCADFGNSVYNDHHYHFGYWIMTSCVVWLLMPKWAEKNCPLLRDITLQLIWDVVHPSSMGNYTSFRMFEWFLGHSNSHGITPSRDGKDQESTSEEFNCYYSIYLFGTLFKHKQLEQIGHLLVKLCIRSAQTYFLLEDGNDVHPESFYKNKVTGILFGNKVDYATWFSPKTECIHGIQMLPVNAHLPLLRNPKFVQEEWDQILSKIPLVRGTGGESGWESLLYTNAATVPSHRAMALEKLKMCPMDDGIARSWALYYACTQPSAPSRHGTPSTPPHTPNSLSATHQNLELHWAEMFSPSRFRPEILDALSTELDPSGSTESSSFQDKIRRLLQILVPQKDANERREGLE